MMGYYKLPEVVYDDIKALEDYVERYKTGEVSHAKFRGFRVPMGIYEQREKDIFMMRVRIPGGGITPRQLAGLAEIAKEFGVGLHITTRQDIQIHHVKLDQLVPIYKKLLAIGLTCKGGGGNTVRNITACPLAGICKREEFNVFPYCVALTEYMLPFPSSYNLPRKFKIAFSGCASDCAFATVNDLGFIAKVKDGEKGFSVYAAGGMGAISRVGLKLHDFIPASEIFYVAEAVKRLFDKYGNRKNKHRARLRFVLDRMSEEEFIKLYQDELETVKKEGQVNFDVRTITDDGSHEPRAPIEQPRDEGFERWLSLFVIEQKQEGYFAVRIPVPLGDIAPDFAETVAEICEDLGKPIRTTQSQDLLITWVHKSELPFFYNRLGEIGLSDGRRNINYLVCCRGASTCKLGLCRSQDLSRAIADELDRSGVMLSDMLEVTIRINGCPNACGQSPIGSIGLHGVARRVGTRSVPFYAISLGGYVEEGKTRLAETIDQIPAKNVPTVIREFLAAYQLRRNEFPSFLEFIESEGKSLIRQLIEQYKGVPDYEENPDFYKDYGSDEEFSLAGRSAGECGAGVFDMIESDIREAKNSYDAYQKTSNANALYEAVIASARSLLVVRGIDPKDEVEAVERFEEHFVKPGWVSKRFKKLLTAALSFRESGDAKPLIECQELVPALIQRIEDLYQSLDADLKFQLKPEEEKEVEEGERAKSVMTLDLRGVPCPINYVRAKIAIEGMEVGESIDILLDDGEPIRNVPASLENDGQEILEIRKENGHYLLRVMKKV